MATNLYIKTDELKGIASNLKSKSQDIYDVYNTQVINVLSTIKQYFDISGIDSQALLDSFNKIYSELNTQTSELLTFLENKVIPQYDELTHVVSNSFNQELYSKLEALFANIKS